MILTTLALQGSDVLAQMDTDLVPKAPVGSNGLVEIGRIILWLVFFAGILAIVVGGGWLAWEKFNGGVNQAPKVIVGALIGGIIAASATGLMNMVLAASQQG